KLNKPAEGLAAVKHAICLDPDLAYAYQLLCAFYEKEKNFPEAEYAINQALKIDRESVNSLSLKGRILFNQQRITEALEAVNTGLSIDPEHVECLNLKGRILVRLGNKSGAEKFEASLSENPENFYTHTNYGIALVEMGRAKEAIPHFKEALRLNPDYGLAKRYLLGALKLKSSVYNAFTKAVIKFSKFKYGTVVLLLAGVIVSYVYNAYFLAPFIVVLYFYFFTDLAANTVLRFNKFNRSLLLKQEVNQSNVSIIISIAILVTLTYGYVQSDHFFYKISYVQLGIFIHLVFAFYRQSTKPPNALSQFFVYSLFSGIIFLVLSYYIPVLAGVFLFIFNSLLATLVLFRKKL
ncbi:MAG: tetratricopeptide repeat protein, partial [Hymenobacteraceae bacterium]|nr:tetratricopeptide repeat protein [Hymenobacteraceae bacterium]MDX5395898.1 tetratricopeptide repeat protein [Hymenobacteraceae bacterium]MDX5444224.1 tetratricopeptide repeat protein [Hymenobacteraceae bacterium]MDX5511953.1 tetratricopeptide repeat protein [Hymenobacteraceae bacterium]